MYTRSYSNEYFLELTHELGLLKLMQVLAEGWKVLSFLPNSGKLLV